MFQYVMKIKPSSPQKHDGYESLKASLSSSHLQNVRLWIGLYCVFFLQAILRVRNALLIYKVNISPLTYLVHRSMSSSAPNKQPF